MEKYDLVQEFSSNENKAEGIRKYGLKERDKDFYSKKFLFLMVFSICFLFVIMWLLFLLSEKNKKINELNINVIELETKTKCLENMAEMYEEKLQSMMENILKDNVYIKKELASLKDEINRKCNIPPPQIHIENKPPPEPSKPRCVIF